MGMLRTIRRRIEDRVSPRPTPIARVRAWVQSLPTEALRGAPYRVPAIIARKPACARLVNACVQDEIVSRDAVENARRKLALKDRDGVERRTRIVSEVVEDTGGADVTVYQTFIREPVEASP
jgi:hypothetical protein